MVLVPDRCPGLLWMTAPEEMGVVLVRAFGTTAMTRQLALADSPPRGKGNSR